MFNAYRKGENQLKTMGKVSGREPCPICGSLKTSVFEGEDGARVSACSPVHALKSFEQEENEGMRQISRLAKYLRECST